MTVSGVLEKYETTVNPHRTKVKQEDEIIVEVWTRICRILEERALNSTTAPEARKHMRFAAREIRAALVKRHDLINVSDKERLQGAERQCYYVAREVLEELVQDHDFMFDQAKAGHALKRRLNTALTKVRNVIEVVGHNIETLKMGNNPKKENED